MTWLGCIVRMDKDGTFPSDNDGVVMGGAPGCWKAMGLRSPWRSRWDLPTGTLLMAFTGLISCCLDTISLAVAVERRSATDRLSVVDGAQGGT